jgi:hypothetical protein
MRLFPLHRFLTAPPAGESFDTVAALALAGHLLEPAGWLAQLRGVLAPGGHLVVLTTPHPAFRRLHEAGARAGVFRK